MGPGHPWVAVVHLWAIRCSPHRDKPIAPKRQAMCYNFNYFTLLLGLCGTAASLQAQSFLSPDHPKLNVARQVFDELVDAVGDGRTPPQLHMLPSGVSSRRQLRIRSRTQTVESAIGRAPRPGILQGSYRRY